MTRNIRNVLSLVVCLISYLLALWVVVVNIQEIAAEVQGHYTVFSQRAKLNNGEAVIYFGLWTLSFLVLFILSLKNLVKKRALRAGIYGIILILFIVISDFLDSSFYYQLG